MRPLLFLSVVTHDLVVHLLLREESVVPESAVVFADFLVPSLTAAHSVCAAAHP